MSYIDAKEYLKPFNFSSKKNYIEWARNQDILKIPIYANEFYENKVWKGWGDFLGTGNTIHPNWREFNAARKYVRTLGIKKTSEWNIWARSNKRPKDIPKDPRRVYKNKGWIDMSDWLGVELTKDWRRIK